MIDRQTDGRTDGRAGGRAGGWMDGREGGKVGGRDRWMKQIFSCEGISLELALGIGRYWRLEDRKHWILY